MNTLPHKEPERSLGGKGLTGFLWQYAGSVVRGGASMLIGIVLARVLGPEPFGIVAIALALISLANLFMDFGLSSSLIHKRDITEDDIAFATSIQVLFGAVITVLVALSAPLIAALVQMPAASDAIRGLSPVFLIQAFGQTSTGLLRREMEFRALQSASIVSYVVGYAVVGIPLAVMGFDVWSIVIAQIVTTSLNTVIVIALRRHTVRWTLRGDRSLLHFGIQATLSDVANWGVSNLDTVLIGRFFGSAPLGYYNRAFGVIHTPTYSLVSALQGVLFPIYSIIGQEALRVRKLVLATIALVGLLLGPIMVSTAVVSETVIRGLYGSEWIPAAPVLSALSVAMIPLALSSLIGSMLWGTGGIRKDLQVQALTIVALVGVLLASSQATIETAAWGVAAVYWLRLVLLLVQAHRQLDLGWYAVARELFGALVVTIVVACVVKAVDYWLGQTSLAPLAVLTVDGLLGAVSVAVALGCFRSIIFTPSVTWLLSRFKDRIPGKLRGLLGFLGLEHGGEVRST